MTDLHHQMPRRAIIKGAGLGLVAGALAGATRQSTAAAADGGAIWSREYWAK